MIDASEYVLGAVLSQDSEKGERPVAYGSRKLTDAESRYSDLVRELLAIMWAVEHFRPNVFGRRFSIHTDHRPLQWVGKLKESSARITRWKELLGQFNMEIAYKPGKENVVADWLSRAITINAAEEEQGEPSGGVRQFLREWTPGKGETSNTQPREEGAPSSGDDSSTGDRPSEIEEIDEIVYDKKLQLIWKTRTSGLMKVEYSKYGQTSINTIWSQPVAREDQICWALTDASKAGRTYYLYVGNEVIWRRSNGCGDWNKWGSIGLLSDGR
nr:uncharacterized protein LOC112211445 [Halyomorpha halys]